MNAILYAAPGTCARVTAICLEELAIPYEYRVIRFMKGEHKSGAYRQFNPKGKVPALVLDGEALTENVAIIEYLNACYPSARLMPPADAPLDKARQLADLCFCASTLHPLVTRIRMPQLFAGQAGAAAVWESGAKAMCEYFQLVEDRLAAGQWWYGPNWSAMDPYLYWVFWRVAGAEFDVSPYPRYQDHAARMEARATTQRALQREAEATRQLEAEGLVFTPPPRPR